MGPFQKPFRAEKEFRKLPADLTLNLSYGSLFPIYDAPDGSEQVSPGPRVSQLRRQAHLLGGSLGLPDDGVGIVVK